MDIHSFKTLLLFTVFLFADGRVMEFCNNPSPPVCADDCNGNGYYLNEDETACIQCPTCSPGQELNKVCGNGLNGDAVCNPCQEGYYSSSTSRYCTPCTICINTLEEEPCQPTQDRVCGDCLSGFVRSSGRFSTNHNECPERCSDLPSETPECSEWWRNERGDPIELDEDVPPPIDKPVGVVPLDDLDSCEPVPPRCIDRCGDGSFFLDKDGLCKACLQCQPGEELNKVCGRGKNGDAYCQRCRGETFSEDGLGRCMPCRICVNTVATECTPTRDAECGECLPGYYQDADEFFPDHGACPNRCIECPSIIAQCQEWCESSEHTDAVAFDAVEPINQGAPVSPSLLEPEFQPDTNETEVNLGAASGPATHASYNMIFIALASLIAVVVIILVVILFAFRYSWRRSNASITGETTLLPSVTSSPRSSPESSPSAVYRATTYPSDGEAWEFMNLLRKFPSEALSNIIGSRPVSGSPTDGGNSSSGASTPIMNLNRRSENTDLKRHTLGRQVDIEHGGLSTSSGRNPSHCNRDKVSNERSGYMQDTSRPGVSSSSKVVRELRESGSVHQQLQDVDEAPGRLVRRRQSIVQSNNDEQPPLGDASRLPRNSRSSLPGPLGDAPRLPRNIRSSLPGLRELHLDNTPIEKPLHEYNSNTAQDPEPEAALFPPSDSAREEVSVTNVPTDTNAKSPDGPNNPGQSTVPIGLNISPSKPQPDSTDTDPSEVLINLPETSPTQTYPKTNPVPVIININMATKGIDTFHVGDVHNSPNCNQPDTRTSGVCDDDDDDEDETYKLLNDNTTTGLHGDNQN